MQLRFICPYCSRVECLSDVAPTFGSSPCVHTVCSCGMRNRYYIVVINPVGCLGCQGSLQCNSPKVYPIKGTFKKQKKRARKSEEVFKM